MTTITPKEAELVCRLLALYHADDEYERDEICEDISYMAASVVRSLEFKVGYPEPIPTAEEKAMERADYLNDCARDARLEAKLSPN